MKVYKELVLLDNASPGDQSKEIINVNCDILSLAVLGEEPGDYKVILEGSITKDAPFVPIAVFPLDTYKLINGEDGITEDGLYETGIEGVRSIRVRSDSGSSVAVSVYARFANSCLA